MGIQKHSASPQWQIVLSRNYQFQLNLWVALSFVIILSVMLRLGFWQLERRSIKLEHNHAVATFVAQHNTPLTYEKALSAFAKHGRKASDITVSLHGKFSDTPIIFHDNRIHQMQAGLHALALFEPDDTRQPAVLINLGWLPWPSADRAVLPSLDLPKSALTLQGNLFAPNPETWTLEQTPPTPSEQGWLLQKLDLTIISEQAKTEIAPFTLRLQPSSAPHLPADPQGTRSEPIRAFPATTDWAMTPEKHMGYAVQWFVMSLVLTGIFLGVNLKKQPVTV